ncbi:hypothetical protein [Clostridium ganghwense]|uniref:Uncharacterized protein n=1 Tax=Clostridium ganghwense TaxID=312089 RepID=A0ABT4CQ60_9CLOT|nr:hypothetical protein [Clostridium ganghwense]MCY6370216.1 hypothetical protein [Clostridium ganghwense]
MQISLYIGRRKKKDKIVDDELLKYIEGDRSDRIKDLILKGLIFEGRKDIDDKLLDMRYLYNGNITAAAALEVNHVPVQRQVQPQPQVQPQVQPTPVKPITQVQDKPDFKGIKIKRKSIVDEDLESRI